MAKVSITDEIKALRTEIRELKRETFFSDSKSMEFDRRLKAIQTDVSDLGRNLNQKFDDLKKIITNLKPA